MPSDNDRDSMAQEVDKLLKKLPGAQTKLAHETGWGSGGGGGTGTHGPRAAHGRETTPRDRVVTWIKVAVGVVVGVLMLQYPLVHDCGVLLYGYLGACLAVAVIGGSGAMAAWRHRIALAHVVSLMVIFWAIVLAADEILPRIGYAVQQATWTCPAQAAPPATTPPANQPSTPAR